MGEEEVDERYSLKGNVEEVKEGFVEVDWGDCWSLLLLGGLKIKLFSATNQDILGPSILSRNTLFTF